MSLYLYSTLSGQKEKFKPIKADTIKLYTCGPTVYSTPHIGNFRTYVVWDIIVGTLRFLGYNVNHVMNITDVGHLTGDEDIANEDNEDKMEKAAKRENLSAWEIARKYEKEFLDAFELLQIKSPNVVCRATEHIPQMISMIEVLLEKGHAYATPSGIYYDIGSFPEYGKLSGNTLENLEAGAGGRVEEVDDKKSPHDFALWILGKEQTMMWDSPWGRGYPGWHIECSAMSKEYLGDGIDIHGGGEDNLFPHHECEIAQSEGSSGHDPFSKYWMHIRHMTVDGQKMSKSKGNIFTLSDFHSHNISPREFRFLVLKSHYRSTMDFTWEMFDEVKRNIDTIDRFLIRLDEIKIWLNSGDVSKEVSEMLNNVMREIVEHMEDDFNTPKILAEIFGLIRFGNSRMDEGFMSPKEADAFYTFLQTIDESLKALLPWEDAGYPEAVTTLAHARSQAKADKDYALADELRKKAEDLGYKIEDTKDGGYRIIRLIHRKDSIRVGDSLDITITDVDGSTREFQVT